MENLGDRLNVVERQAEKDLERFKEELENGGLAQADDPMVG